MLRRNRERELLSTPDRTQTGPAALVPAGPVEVAVDVPAPADHIIEWFLDPARWPRFQGRHAWIDPRPGGRLRVELGDGVFIAGEFREIGDQRIRFSWGREEDALMPPGSTTVTVVVSPTGPSSSRIELVHEGLPDRTLADEHGGGWRYHLVRLGVAASGAVDDDEVVDLFLAATREPHPITRRGLLERTCTDDVQVADGVDDTLGLSALAAKLGRLLDAAGEVQLVRSGNVRRVGALLRCDYVLRDADGTEHDAGELVAHVDRARHMTAISLFD